MQEEGDIGSQGCRQLMQLLGDEGSVKDLVHPLEHGGRIAAPSAETGSMRDPLHEGNGHPVRDPRLFAESLHGLHAEVLRSRWEIRIIANQGDAVSRHGGDLDLVGKLDRHHQGLQFMKAVRALSQNAERKVDLGRSGECDGCRFPAHPPIV